MAIKGVRDVSIPAKSMHSGVDGGTNPLKTGSRVLETSKVGRRRRKQCLGAEKGVFSVGKHGSAALAQTHQDVSSTDMSILASWQVLEPSFSHRPSLNFPTAGSSPALTSPSSGCLGRGETL